MDTAKAKIETAIKEYVKNYHTEKNTETTWKEPIIGYADATDPLFEQLKKIANPEHEMPTQLLKNAKTVIAYFVPFGEEIIKSNIKAEESSREWDMAKIETNIIIEDIAQEIKKIINEMGYEVETDLPTNFDKEKLLSKWSKRHVAYIAGIGTFGIHNLLITESGCCGRIGNVITTIKLQPTQRDEKEKCLYKRNGTCKACVKKCVANAITTENGYPYVDRHLCDKQIDKLIQHYQKGDGDACGKCSCGVPCSTTNPSAKLN
ncbi:MAG: hypothetical protein RR272_00055 [Synergistaceae bacterium]